MSLARTSTEIDDQSAKAGDSISEGMSRWPGMTYEEGVDAALRWVTGDSDDAPMDGDE
ncbi:MAG TPA: hypothetical protein VIT65_10680 [Microlunatus sp.]